MTDEQLELSLGEEEVVFLVRALGFSGLPNVDDPTAQLPPGEAEAALRAAAHSLEARGLVQADVAGNLLVHPTVRLVFETCARPSVSIVLTVRTTDGEADGRTFHQSVAGMLVEHSLPAPGVHVFRDLSGTDLGQFVGKSLHVDGEIAPDCPPGHLRQSALSQAMETAIRDRASGVRQLEAGGLLAATAEALATTMHVARVNGAIARVDHHGDSAEDVRGFATLAGGSQLWLLLADADENADGVTVQPASADEVRSRLAEVCRLA